MDNSEFVFTQTTDENGNKIVIGGGYKIDSYFLKEGKPIMTTYNKDIHNINENISRQNGGKNVSSSFENLAVPAGIFYVNQKVPKLSTAEIHYNENRNMLPEDIYDKLLSLVQQTPKKKNTRKNRKNLLINNEEQKIHNKSSKKTRRNK
jgi:hypothetical protein